MLSLFIHCQHMKVQRGWETKWHRHTMTMICRGGRKYWNGKCLTFLSDFFRSDCSSLPTVGWVMTDSNRAAGLGFKVILCRWKASSGFTVLTHSTLMSSSPDCHISLKLTFWQPSNTALVFGRTPRCTFIQEGISNSLMLTLKTASISWGVPGIYCSEGGE